MRIAALTIAAALAVSLAVAAAPLRAQTADEPGSGAEKPLSERIEEAIRGFVESVEPALEQLRDTFEVFERVDSLDHYEEPEILPNGDIVIRRKEDAPPYEPESTPKDAPGEGAGEGAEPGIRT